METRTLTFDPNTTWQRLLETPGFTSGTPEGPTRELFREFVVTRLAEVVGDQLDKPLTLASMMETQRRILRHHVDTDFLGRLIDAMPEESFGFLGKEGVREAMSTLFAGLVEMIERIIPDIPAFLADNGVSEEQMLANPRGGSLSASSMDAYRAGTLTVGGLLMTDPWTVLNFNKRSTT